jgi:hypothetical protein
VAGGPPVRENHLGRLSVTTFLRSAVLSGLLLGSCSSVTELELEDAPPAVCRVHGSELGVVLVPVEHGSLNAGRVPGYEAARGSLFPRAVVPQLSGRVHELTLEEHCVDCTIAEFEWLCMEFDGVIFSDEVLLPTFYERVPEAEWPVAEELASCDLHATRFEVVLTPVGYGCGIPIEGYRDAEALLFPNKMTPRKWGGPQKINVVEHCPDCTIAEHAWVEQLYGPCSFHPFYEVPPNARAPHS